MLDDEHEFRAAHPDDPAIDALVARFGGRPADAEQELRDLIARHPGNDRLRALFTDARRDQGDVATAEAMYTKLVTTEARPLMRATLVQHLGTTLFTAGRYAEAAACFADALRARSDHGASDDLLESSRLALATARRRAGLDQALPSER